MPKIEQLDDNTIKELLGKELFDNWNYLIDLVLSEYDMDKVWHAANKGNVYELKIRRGGKTLISFFTNYPEKDSIGVLIIFGKDERSKFEEQKDQFSKYVYNTYQNSKTFHDGKWVKFKAPNKDLEKDLLNMLAVKRKPNKK